MCITTMLQGRIFLGIIILALRLRVGSKEGGGEVKSVMLIHIITRPEGGD